MSFNAFSTLNKMTTKFKAIIKTWSRLGTGIPYDTGNSVNAVVTDSAGNVYVGGLITSVNSVAKYNGSTWSTLIGPTGPAGIGPGFVYAMTIDYLGNIYVGGSFLTAGGVTVNRVAKYNGSSWSALIGSNLIAGVGNTVRAIVCDSLGNVYVGGDFLNAGGITVNHIAKFNVNNNTWNALGTTGTTGNVHALEWVGSKLYIAGQALLSYNGTYNIVDYDVLNDSFGTPLIVGNIVYALAYDVGSNNLYFGGDFLQAGGIPYILYVCKYNLTDNTYNILGIPNASGTKSRVRALKCYSKEIVYVGGDFVSAGVKNDITGGTTVGYVAVYNDNTKIWSGLAGPSGSVGVDNGVLALAFDGPNKLYIGGYFTRVQFYGPSVNRIDLNYIAKYS